MTIEIDANQFFRIEKQTSFFDNRLFQILLDRIEAEYSDAKTNDLGGFLNSLKELDNNAKIFDCSLKFLIQNIENTFEAITKMDTADLGEPTKIIKCCMNNIIDHLLKRYDLHCLACS